jgi:hypothetical protein
MRSHLFSNSTQPSPDRELESTETSHQLSTFVDAIPMMATKLRDHEIFEDSLALIF